MPIIKDEDLDFEENQIGDVIAYYEGVPFTGISFEENNGCKYEYTYENGLQHGISRGFYANGNKMEEIDYSEGNEEESSKWYESGQLREYRNNRYDALVRVRKWTETGVLIYESLNRGDIIRSFYNSGALKYERTRTITKYYTKSQEVAFWHEGKWPEDTKRENMLNWEENYSKVIWDDEVMKRGCYDLVDDSIVSLMVWHWVNIKLVQDSATYGYVLCKLIGHSDTKVKSIAINIAGYRHIYEAIDVIQKELGNNERLSVSGQTISEIARNALAKLTDDKKIE